MKIKFDRLKPQESGINEIEFFPSFLFPGLSYNPEGIVVRSHVFWGKKELFYIRDEFSISHNLYKTPEEFIKANHREDDLQVRSGKVYKKPVLIINGSIKVIRESKEEILDFLKKLYYSFDLSGMYSIDQGGNILSLRDYLNL